jgi:murein DD-endopeptidase MepM/ murein hydrolase activator NlpD
MPPLTFWTSVGRVARTLEFQEGLRVQRVRGWKAAAGRLVASRLLASLPVIVLLGPLVPERIASGELRPDSRPQVAPGIVLPGSPDDAVQVRHLVTAGETFAGILRERGLSAAEIRAWEQAAAGVYDLGAIQPRHALVLTFTRDQGQLAGCEYEVDKYALLSMRLVHGQIQARMKAMPRLAAVRGVAGRVEASLATSATAAGIPARMVSELADVFGWELDLQADVRPGDQFRLLYAELRDEDGGAVRPGDILAAEITSGGRTLTAIRFENERGESEYYDPEGRALGRHFLRYPLDFVRITSQFTDARLHPVLKRWRRHLGVDFAAARGTPVRAVASGVVTFAGRNGEYGNHVAIDHQTPYGSSYSHLQRIARGLRRGAAVRKGQVIGYVGRSGLATGPHLHFMLFKNGTYVNPLTARLPSDEQLTGANRARFASLRHELLDRLAKLGGGIEVPALSLAPLSVPGMIRSGAASYVD